MKPLSKLFLLICCSVPLYSYGQNTDKDQQTVINTGNKTCGSGCCCGMETQTPSGIMTDHIHNKGEWMATCTYMDTRMKGNHIGATPANDNMVYRENYMMAPETMNMQMHMAMLMYGLTNKLTLMGMAGFTSDNMMMNMATNMPGMNMTPGNTTMQSLSSGFTDTKIYGLYNLSGKESQRIIASMGASIPTGTFKATGVTMLGENQRLPYDMQPGTGSFSIIPGITYVHQYNRYSLGVDAGADIKLSGNTLGYKQGNVYQASAWASRRLLPFVSGSIRAEEIVSDKITGSDPAIAIPVYETNDPTANTANYGGKMVNIYAGPNFHFDQPVLKNFQLHCEYGVPVYQNLNGTQMSEHSNLVAGLMYKF